MPHDKTPWAQEIVDRNWKITSGGNILANMVGDNQELNAKHIVKCIECYDEFRAMLTDAHDALPEGETKTRVKALQDKADEVQIP